MRFGRLFVPVCVIASMQAALAFGQVQPGGTFRDCPECPEMVAVAGGTFLMGAAPGEEEREEMRQDRGRSQPQVTVAVAAFALGRYEVTRGQFSAFVTETGYAAKGECNYIHVADLEWTSEAELNWKNPGFRQDDQHPVVCVTWNDAQAYVAWLSRKTGKSYRLPSEAEWEYAARAGSQSARPWGDSAAQACAHANVLDARAPDEAYGIPQHRCDDEAQYTAPVGKYPANRFGLHDMIGNASEWMQDCWSLLLAGVPQNGAARLFGDCSQRAIRGGSWIEGPKTARSAFRNVASAGFRGYITGFRVARAP